MEGVICAIKEYIEFAFNEQNYSDLKNIQNALNEIGDVNYMCSSNDNSEGFCCDLANKLGNPELKEDFECGNVEEILKTDFVGYSTEDRVIIETNPKRWL